MSNIVAEPTLVNGSAPSGFILGSIHLGLDNAGLDLSSLTDFIPNGTSAHSARVQLTLHAPSPGFPEDRVSLSVQGTEIGAPVVLSNPPFGTMISVVYNQPSNPAIGVWFPLRLDLAAGSVAPLFDSDFTCNCHSPADSELPLGACQRICDQPPKFPGGPDDPHDLCLSGSVVVRLNGFPAFLGFVPSEPLGLQAVDAGDWTEPFGHSIHETYSLQVTGVGRPPTLEIFNTRSSNDPGFDQARSGTSRDLEIASFVTDCDGNNISGLCNLTDCQDIIGKVVAGSISRAAGGAIGQIITQGYSFIAPKKPKLPARICTLPTSNIACGGSNPPPDCCTVPS